jgi:hypothetical protein
MKKYLLIVLILLFAQSLPGYAQEEENNYFNKPFNVVLNGGIGYGAAAYAITRDDEAPEDAGGGYGLNFAFNGLVNFLFLGAEFSFNRANMADAEYTMTDSSGNERTIESKGNGKYQTFDFKAGLFLGTEPEDMGYFFLYFGYRNWQGSYDSDSVTVDGVINVDPEYLVDSETTGSGWISGFRDYSTFPIPMTHIAIVLRTGLWITSAPGDSIEVNNDKKSYRDSGGIGIGYELGIGIAFEDMGLSVDLQTRLDATLTYGTLEDDSGFGAVYGSAAYILSATYTF